jgi:hypothetical protein
MKTSYGKTYYAGAEYELTQNAYLSDTGAHYIGRVKDKDGNLYLATWVINCADFDSLTDENDACDWRHAYCVELIEAA